ncbi:DUF2306 domain-containing protein [Maricaulis sp. CAU 1757]
MLSIDYWVDDAAGLAHMGLALLALATGPAVFLLRKGTTLHRSLGYVYLLSMLVVNITALTQYDINGGFTLFHGFAILSLAGLLAGFWAIRSYVHGRRPAALVGHAKGMAWSYFGLFAAGTSQTLPRIFPGLASSPEAFYIFLAVSLIAGGALTSWMLKRALPGFMARYAQLPG